MCPTSWRSSFQNKTMDPSARCQQIQFRGTVGEVGDLVPGGFRAAVVCRSHAHDAGDAGRRTNARGGFLVSGGGDGCDSDGAQPIGDGFVEWPGTVAFTGERLLGAQAQVDGCDIEVVAEFENPFQAQDHIVYQRFLCRVLRIPLLHLHRSNRQARYFEKTCIEMRLASLATPEKSGPLPAAIPATWVP